MTDAPSPYAPPATVSDERAPPRPAGRAVVFLVASFVLAIVSSELWRTWSSMRASLATEYGNSIVLATTLFGIPAMLSLLWAYLSDAVPLWGTRREGYLMLASVLIAIVWVALAVASHRDGTWLAVAVPFGLATAVARVAILGALAEIGRRRAATGRLAAANIGLGQLAAFVALPLTAVDVPFTLTGGVAAGLALAVVVMIATLSADGAPAPAPTLPARISIPMFLRSRPFWTTVAISACVGISSVPNYIVRQQERALPADDAASWLTWGGSLLQLGAAVVYLLACRRARFGALIRLALLAKAIGMGVYALASRGTDGGHIRLALMAADVGTTFAAVALLDLVLRVAPPGREAFGAVLLFGLATVTAVVVNTSATMIQATAAGAASFAAGAALVALLAVSLLPRAVVEPREARDVNPT